MNKRGATIFLACLLALTLAAVPACKKGDSNDSGGSGGNDDDETNFQEITFEPAAAGGAGTVRLVLDEADPAAGTFSLKVIGDSLPAYGVAGRLLFDSGLCSLDAAEPGDALEGGSATVIAAASPNGKGGVFGFTRSGDYQHGAALAADKAVGRLNFTVKKTGQGDIAFSADRSRILNEGLEAVDVSEWIGGKLIVK